MYSLMTAMHRIFSNITDVDKVWRSHFFLGQAKVFAKVVFGVVLLLDSPLAEAESATAKLGVSARVIRRCGISSNLLDFGNSHAQAVHENSEIKVGNRLIINCNADSRGTMALSVSANLVGNALIRVSTDENSGLVIHKEVSSVHRGDKSQARHIDLGVFPAAGAKAILIKTDNFIGNLTTIEAGERTMTLIINF